MAFIAEPTATAPLRKLLLNIEALSFHVDRLTFIFTQRG
jgi:hypothetical protein